MSTHGSPVAQKARANRIHFRNRVWSRYGMFASDLDVDWIESGISTGARWIVPIRPDATHPNRQLYAVFFGHRFIPVVYDSATKSVMTALPDGALDSYDGVLRAARKSFGDHPQPTSKEST